MARPRDRRRGRQVGPSLGRAAPAGLGVSVKIQSRPTPEPQPPAAVASNLIVAPAITESGPTDGDSAAASDSHSVSPTAVQLQRVVHHSVAAASSIFQVRSVDRLEVEHSTVLVPVSYCD
eukprot:g5368.t1